MPQGLTMQTILRFIPLAFALFSLGTHAAIDAGNWVKGGGNGYYLNVPEACKGFARDLNSQYNTNDYVYTGTYTVVDGIQNRWNCNITDDGEMMRTRPEVRWERNRYLHEPHELSFPKKVEWGYGNATYPTPKEACLKSAPTSSSYAYSFSHTELYYDKYNFEFYPGRFNCIFTKTKITGSIPLGYYLGITVRPTGGSAGETVLENTCTSSEPGLCPSGLGDGSSSENTDTPDTDSGSGTSDSNTSVTVNVDTADIKSAIDHGNDLKFDMNEKLGEAIAAVNSQRDANIAFYTSLAEHLSDEAAENKKTRTDIENIQLGTAATAGNLLALKHEYENQAEIQAQNHQETVSKLTETNTAISGVISALTLSQEKDAINTVVIDAAIKDLKATASSDAQSVVSAIASLKALVSTQDNADLTNAINYLNQATVDNKTAITDALTALSSKEISVDNTELIGAINHLKQSSSDDSASIANALAEFSNKEISVDNSGLIKSITDSSEASVESSDNIKKAIDSLNYYNKEGANSVASAVRAIKDAEIIEAVNAIDDAGIVSAVNAIDDEGIIDAIESLDASEDCVPTDANNHCESDHGLNESVVNDVMDSIDSVFTEGKEESKSWFEGIFSDITSSPDLNTDDLNVFENAFNKILPQSTNCQPLQFGHSSKIWSFTISCTASDKFKSVFSFLIYVWTITQLIDIVFTSITPKPRHVQMH